MAPVEIFIVDQVGVAVARQKARELARALNFDKVAVEQIALAVSELGNNLWQHAGAGFLRLEPCAAPRVGLRVLTEDQGPGIPDMGRALEDGVSSRGGLGSGLAGVQRLMDHLDIHSTLGVGTRVEAIKWRS